MFSNQALKNLIIPLFFEQLLVAFVGIADVFIIGFVSEEAVSGVSLVNSFNTIFLYLFIALASGGAVVISQYIGKKDFDQAGETASQLLIFSIVFSVVIESIILIYDKKLMELIFGHVENEVMDACVTYLRISAYSYPALAIYNAGTAMYRSFGKTSTTLHLSLIANIINIIGNIIGVFVLHAGVPGVAYPSLIARVFSAAAITFLCFSMHNPIYYTKKWILGWNTRLQRQILSIAVPNGIESGVFQLVKVALSSVVSLFGTYQIAANGVAQSLWNMSALVCVTMGPVYITVIGQCMGAENTEQAEYYFKKLTKITMLFALLWNGLIFAVTPFLMQFYALSAETKQLVILLVLVHNIFNTVSFPLADPLGKGLRAAGDVKFTTVVSLFTTIGVRLLFAVFFGIYCNLGVMGIAYAMCLDWSIRGIIFWLRFKSGIWKHFNVIE